MQGKTRNALLGYGFRTDLIDKLAARGHTLTELRALSRQKLLQNYTSDEVDEIRARVNRTPIAEDTIASVAAKSSSACCFCADGNSTRPFQLHHVDPYSDTQENSEENLLLVCPTHHATIHANGLSRVEQKSLRRQWYATVEIASDFAAKGLVFPFGAFQALDYESPARPAELVEFGPLSPSTDLLCYAKELATTARERLECFSFLLILGGSGSGKSTYALALGGLYASEGFRVFRHRFDKRGHDALKQVTLFASTCVHKAVLILDDANVWATAADIQEIGKLAARHGNIRVVATWTSDDSDDGSRLQASDLPRQTLSWPDLRAAVVETLLQHEGEIVESLQRYERDRSIGSLGLGSLHYRLEHRIQALGDRPKTVYEFIFGLRGDSLAVADELNELSQNDRAHVPVLCIAIEQIAGFERPISVEETVAACHRIEGKDDLPPASAEWVRSVLDSQVAKRRLVRVRQQYTTIHRKWAARLVAAGLTSSAAKHATERLLSPELQINAAAPERLLRLWSWLRALNESCPFIKTWEKSLHQEDWQELASRCAERGLTEIGFLASRMHLLFDSPTWTETVGTAFTSNVSAIAPLVHGASPNDWYWLRELSMVMEHACTDAWKEILSRWNRESAAALILSTDPSQFQNVSWSLGGTGKLCPGWLEEVGKHLPWDSFSSRFTLVQPGDLRSLSETFGVFGAFGYKLRRSMLRTLAEAMAAAFRPASLDDLQMPTMNTSLMLLTLFFPLDAQRAFSSINAQRIGRELQRSLPRHWRSLCELSSWTDNCDSDISEQILEACDTVQLERQARRYGPSNRYELRLLLHFIRRATPESRRLLAAKLRDVVHQACEPRDSEARSIITAYQRLDAELGAALATELGIVAEEIEEDVERESLEASREEFRTKDGTGEDYDIEFGDDSGEAGSDEAKSDSSWAGESQSERVAIRGT